MVKGAKDRAYVAPTSTLRAATSRWMTLLRSRKAMAEDTPTAMTAIDTWSMDAAGLCREGRHLQRQACVRIGVC